MTKFMQWLGRKFIPWDPWSVKAIGEREWLRGRNNGIRLERLRVVKLLQSKNVDAEIIALIKGKK